MEQWAVVDTETLKTGEKVLIAECTSETRPTLVLTANTYQVLGTYNDLYNAGEFK